MQALLNEELYQAHCRREIELNQDQLDYLMCMAIYYRPEYSLHSGLNFRELWFWYIDKVIDVPEYPDPQLVIIQQVRANRDRLNVLNDWSKTVLYTYKLVIEEIELNQAASDEEVCCPLLFNYLKNRKSDKDKLSVAVPPLKFG